MLTGDGCRKCQLIKIMQLILNSKEIDKKKKKKSTCDYT